MGSNENEKEMRFIEFIHSRKFLSVLAFFMCVLFIVGWIVLVKNENRIIELKSDLNLPMDESTYVYNLENVTWKKDDISITKDYVCISGWLIKRGEQVDKAAIKIVLKDVETGKCFLVPTDVVTRPDVTEYFADNNKYDYSGFSVKIPYWVELDTDKDYELFAQYDLNDNTRVYVPFHTTLKMKAEELGNEG